MKTRPEITDDEIRAYMDFDSLLEMNKKAPSKTFTGLKYLILAGLVVGVGLTYWLFIFKADKPGGEPQADIQNQLPLPADKREPPGIDSVQKKIPHAQTSANTAIPDKKGTKAHDERPLRDPEVVDRDSNEPETQSLPHPLPPPSSPVYAQAEPVDGYPNLYEYFNRELKYPEEALKDSIQGEVTAIFRINIEGTAEGITIENSLGAPFDAEVIRLITNMPPWKPATYNNKPVASKMSLPLTFQIKKITLQK